jgi:GPH family glycoside/pentoside/hexuronide:cation symporter
MPVAQGVLLILSMSGAPQLQRHQQLGWAAGSLGTAVMLGTLTSFGLFYMTTYLGVGAALAGLLVGLSKGYDMLTDPLMGQISDRTHSRWGRRRPYLILGAIGAPVSIVLLFLVPAFANFNAMVVYLALALLLYATAFTLFNVPYLAMPAEMTTEPDERTLIMSQRIFFSTLGVLTITTLGPQLIRHFGGGAQGYIKMSWVMAAIVCCAMLLTFQLTKHVATVPPSRREDYGLLRQWRLVLGNRPFRFYMAAKICMFLAQTAVQGTLLYYAHFVLGRDEMLLAAYGVGYTGGSVVTLPLWNYLISKKLGKRNAFRISAIGLGLVFLSWLLAGPAEPVMALYVRFVVLGIFSAGIMIAGSAMLPDIMEYDRRTTGINQEGLYAAAFSLVEKVANALGPMIIGLLLGLTGFIESRDGILMDQPDSAVTAIRYSVSVLPCALAFAAAILIGYYDLRESATPGSQAAS